MDDATQNMADVAAEGRRPGAAGQAGQVVAPTIIFVLPGMLSPWFRAYVENLLLWGDSDELYSMSAVVVDVLAEGKNEREELIAYAVLRHLPMWAIDRAVLERAYQPQG